MKNLTKFVAAGALAVGVASFASGTSQAAGLSQKEYNNLASSLNYDIHTAATKSTSQADYNKTPPYRGINQKEYQRLASQYS